MAGPKAPTGAYVVSKRTGQKMSVTDMYAEFNRQLDEQNRTLPPNWWLRDLKPKSEALDKAQQEIVKMLTDMMVETLSMSTLWDALKDNFLTLDKTDFKSKEQREGYYGVFLEKALFGIGGNEALPDVRRYHDIPIAEEWETEIKSTLSGRELTVGGLTVYGLEQVSNLKDKYLLDTLAMHKMLVKMQNLLYIRTQEMVRRSGRRGIGFQAIILFTSLYLKAVKDLITRSATELITIQPAGGLRQDNNTIGYHQEYKIKINLSATGDLLKGIKNLRRLYLREFDFLNVLEGSSFRAFFYTIRRLKDWFETGP